MADYLVREEDGTSRYTLEDGSGSLLLENPIVQPGFIASLTVVFGADASPRQLFLSTIPSVTQVFTPAVEENGAPINTSGTWTAPAGITQVHVDAWGGGGNGNQDPWGTGNGGAGGGGGAYSGGIVAVTPGVTYSYTVGAAAGDTTFVGDSGATILAKGGGNATNGTNPNTAPGAGGLASAGQGTVKFSGGNGNPHDSGQEGGGGGGAAGFTGNGAAGVPSNSITAGLGNLPGGNGGNGGWGSVRAGQPGVAPGGAGGGGWQNVGAGGAGAGGRLILTWGQLLPAFIGSVTQVYGTAGTPMLSQEAVEVLGDRGPVSIRLSQEATEVLADRGSVPIYLTQEVVEALRGHPPTRARMTQIAIEVLAPYQPPSAGRLRFHAQLV